MKILNLYAGLGGNRQLWGDKHEITAVENNTVLADCYIELYPKDMVYGCDAIEFLKLHYQDFDFIWASPECYTHTRFTGRNHKPKFPDLILYSMNLFLQRYYKGLFCIENVIPWYVPLITPTVNLGRHCIWANFDIPRVKFELYNVNLKNYNPGLLAEVRGISPEILLKIKGKWRNHDMKSQVLRNMINPLIGKYILEMAMENHKL